MAPVWTDIQLAGCRTGSVARRVRSTASFVNKVKVLHMLYHPRREWTLASFLPRRNSQHARAAGIRFVAQQRPPPITLVMAGPPGSGKTHLLHALAQHARSNPAINCMACLSAKQWAQEVAAGLYFGDGHKVMQHFAQQHLLALDDVDFLWGLQDAHQAFAQLLRTRQAQGLRTLLTATLYPATSHNPQPLCALLAEQAAVRLW